jgi:hypothetical protein
MDSGDWAWTAWSRYRSGSGIEPTQAEAETAAQQELERIVAEDPAADQHRRELPAADTRPKDWIRSPDEARPWI